MFFSSIQKKENEMFTSSYGVYTEKVGDEITTPITRDRKAKFGYANKKNEYYDKEKYD